MKLLLLRVELGLLLVLLLLRQVRDRAARRVGGRQHRGQRLRRHHGARRALRGERRKEKRKRQHKET